MTGNRTVSSFFLLVSTLMVAVLLMHMYSGSHLRMMADDYCTTLYGQRDGLINGLIFQYNTWAGQFSNILFKNAVGVIGNGVIPLLPTFLIGAWLIVTYWLVNGTLACLHVADSWHKFSFLSVLIVFVTIAAVPVPIQPLYWLAALVPYTLPVIGATALAGLLPRFLSAREDRQRRRILTVVFAVAFVSAGFSEIYSALQTGSILGLLTLALFYRRMRPLLPFCLMALAGSVLAMAVIIAAPGNAIRRSSFPEFVGIVPFVIATITQTIALIFVNIVNFAPAGSTLLLLTAFVVGSRSSRAWVFTKSLRFLLIPVFVVFMAVSAYIAAGVYGVGSVPPARTYTTPQFAIFLGIMAVGFMLGHRWRNYQGTHSRSEVPGSLRVVSGAVALLIALLVLQETREISATLPTLQQFSQSWDERDRLIRQLATDGQRQLNLPPLPNDLAPLVGLQTHTDDPDFWVNSCTAEYYGLESYTIYTDL